jgi:hypothetical protein
VSSCYRGLDRVGLLAGRIAEEQKPAPGVVESVEEDRHPIVADVVAIGIAGTDLL